MVASAHANVPNKWVAIFCWSVFAIYVQVTRCTLKEKYTESSSYETVDRSKWKFWNWSVRLAEITEVVLTEGIHYSLSHWNQVSIKEETSPEDFIKRYMGYSTRKRSRCYRKLVSSPAGRGLLEWSRFHWQQGLASPRRTGKGPYWVNSLRPCCIPFQEK